MLKLLIFEDITHHHSSAYAAIPSRAEGALLVHTYPSATAIVTLT
jgi:hypothetical protein